MPRRVPHVVDSALTPTPGSHDTFKSCARGAHLHPTVVGWMFINSNSRKCGPQSYDLYRSQDVRGVRAPGTIFKEIVTGVALTRAEHTQLPAVTRISNKALFSKSL